MTRFWRFWSTSCRLPVLNVTWQLRKSHFLFTFIRFVYVIDIWILLVKQVGCTCYLSYASLITITLLIWMNCSVTIQTIASEQYLLLLGYYWSNTIAPNSLGYFCSDTVARIFLFGYYYLILLHGYYYSDTLLRCYCSDTIISLILLLRNYSSDTIAWILLLEYFCLDTYTKILLLRYFCSETIVQILLLGYFWSDKFTQILLLETITRILLLEFIQPCSDLGCVFLLFLSWPV